jgi:hypothetical protein
MKTTLFFIICLLKITSIKAQTYEWAKSMGGGFGEQGNSITTDASGNVYTTGWFTETADFNPGSGTFNLTSNGAQDAYIQKMDTSGNFLWAKSFGGTGYEYGYGIITDPAGNVYVTGIFEGTVDFDPGAGVVNLTSSGGQDVFIQKLDASGNFLWTRSFGADLGLSIALDASGNIFTSGTFSGTVDFDPGIGITNLTSAGNFDGFVHKMDASGNFLWVKSFGGTGLDAGASLAVDASGNVYTTGSFENIADFDPGSGTMNLTSAGYDDFFIQKLDASGNLLWAKSVGGMYQDAGNAIALDASGNVFTTGVFVGTVDFDPGMGTTNLTTAGGNMHDAFVQKLDTDGNFLWARSLGGSSYDKGYSISTDSYGNVYTIGSFSGTVDFDPGPGTVNLSAANAMEFFIQKMGASGNYAWVESIGGSSSVAIGNDISVDASNNVYLTGWFKGFVDFDPGPGTVNLTSYGGSDIFVQKWSQCLAISTGVDVVTTCDPFTWIDGITYTASNSIATHFLTTASGCDSIVTLKLTINSNTSTDVVAACDSYTWMDGNTYTASNNTATYTLTNILGCDSVITLNLTINSVGTDVVTACDSYRWINGITYTASNNTATYTLNSAAGCDSVVTLNLTIHSTPDVTTVLNGITISANTANATYQWLDCDDNYAAIPGATSQNFTAAANGDYAVEITENGCKDTSACVEIKTVGLPDLDFGSKIAIFPNPTDGNFSIDLGSVYESTEISMTDITGKVIDKLYAAQTQVVSISINEPAGLYFVRVRSREKDAVFKLVKK